MHGAAAGPPLATSRLVRERLRKLVALAVFSSDAISSTAYGTEQTMLILVATAPTATGLAFPIALAALTTALPALQQFVPPLSLAAIGLITWVNVAIVHPPAAAASNPAAEVSARPVAT